MVVILWWRIYREETIFDIAVRRSRHHDWEVSEVALREVGSAFIVIETPEGDNSGRTITILTDRVK